MPLPLAQLLRRAENAKTPLERHLAGYYLWEATVKLWAVISLIESREYCPHDAQLVPYIQSLSNPSMGHWWGLAKTATQVLSRAGCTVHANWLGEITSEQDDMPLAAGLELALSDDLPTETRATAKTVRIDRLFDRLVQYRNREVAHGAVVNRDRKHHERMARGFMGGMRNVLDRLDIIYSRRLLVVTDVYCRNDGDWIIEKFGTHRNGAATHGADSFTGISCQFVAAPR